MTFKKLPMILTKPQDFSRLGERLQPIPSLFQVFLFLPEPLGGLSSFYKRKIDTFLGTAACEPQTYTSERMSHIFFMHVDVQTSMRLR